MLTRRLVVLGGALALVVVAALACEGAQVGDDQGADSGATPGTLGEAVCPGAAPAAGARCLLPEGTTCSFGGECVYPVARCTLGAWHYSGNPPPPCPRDFPTSESACPACWPAEVTCRYGSADCSEPDASQNTTIASCPRGRWVLVTFPCAKDAGADVQRDAEPDAD